MPVTYISEWLREPAVLGGFSSRQQAHEWMQRLLEVSNQIEARFGLPEAPLRAEIVSHGGSASIRIWARRINGWFSVDEHEIVVLPRYLSAEVGPAAGRLFARLLAYSGSSRFEVRDWVGGESANATPADFFARRFLRELEPAMSRGLAADYVVQERRETSLRGRLLVGRLYPELISTPHLLPQIISEYHHDIPANRLLRWACTTLAPQVSDHLVRGELMEASARFADVSPELPPGIELHPLKLPPAHAHFQSAVDLAALLAQGRFLTPGGTTHQTPGLIFVSWHVFQEYVGRLLRDAARIVGHGVRVETQLTARLGTQIGGGPSLSCRPDFVVRFEGIVAVTGDSKYQRPLGVGELPDSGSIAQVLAAARALGAPRGVIFRPDILLPAGVAARGARWWIVGADVPQEVELYMAHPAALTDAFRHRQEVERLAGRIETWVEQIRETGG